MKIFRAKVGKDNVVAEGIIDVADLFMPEDLEIKVNGVKKEKFGSSWNGVTVDAYKRYGALLSAYLSDNECVLFPEICDELINYKNSIQHYSHSYEGKDVPDVVVTPKGAILHLVAISKNGRYYQNEEDFVFAVTNHEGETITDMEDFWVGAISQDWEEDKKFAYIRPDLKDWLSQNY